MCVGRKSLCIVLRRGGGKRGPPESPLRGLLPRRKRATLIATFLLADGMRRALAFPGFAVAACLACSMARPAHAASFVVADPDAPPDLSDDALCFSMLLRSLLGAAERAPVPHEAVRTALGTRAGQALVVYAGEARAFLGRLSAERLLVWKLSADERAWRVEGRVVGAGA